MRATKFRRIIRITIMCNHFYAYLIGRIAASISEDQVGGIEDGTCARGAHLLDDNGGDAAVLPPCKTRTVRRFLQHRSC